jgi:hypothetical protein
MTFKHVKFEDSPTMRALEKVAKEKGLVKPEPIQKQASAPKKLDLTASTDLMENIFKLCTGLRAQGFVKEAAELEVDYLNYKRAQTLYQAHKETGEDLLQMAHPDGSHKLEDVEGDEAVFEDLLDRHVKSLQMVNKKPTGKLTNANALIKEVKKVLGQRIEGIPEMKPMSQDPIEGKLIDEAAWSDGDRANAKYISEVLGRAAAPIGKILPLLQQLEDLANADTRIARNVGPAVKSGKEYIGNFGAEFWKACQTAFQKARALEKQRLSVVDDLEQARVSFKEVGDVFKSGILGKTTIGQQKTFTGVLAALQAFEKGLGNLIFDNYSPGFDFDEPYMKGVKDKAMGIFNQIKKELGSQ